jgi:hypothetical protein
LTFVAGLDIGSPESFLAAPGFAPSDVGENVSRHIEVLDDSRWRRQWKLSVREWRCDTKLDFEIS